MSTPVGPRDEAVSGRHVRGKGPSRSSGRSRKGSRRWSRRLRQGKAKHTSRRRGKSRNSVRVLYRRANRRQRAVAVFCGLLILHGIWVLFVPGVQPEADGLPCPPAVVAAVTGSGGLQLTDVSPAMAAYHDAACAAAGRWWLATGVLQIAVAAVWGLATLEWARLRRRALRRERRNQGEAASQKA